MITSNDLYDTALIEYWKVKKNDLGINIWLFKMEACLSFVEVSISTIHQVFFLEALTKDFINERDMGANWATCSLVI